ncbi:MAG TPA: alpha-L-arabinofuranosidase C-terminal domain-containing protein, partial [Chryseolinea sp.]|nr:alpha-L-arabinofuranosidase C-terminal domain-containing protein [Chryseolinea sp.]
IIIKLVNTSDKEQTIDLKFDGSKKLQTKGSVLVLKSNQLDDVNSFENPKQISPVESSITGKSKNYKVTLSANSFSVVRLKAQ